MIKTPVYLVDDDQAVATRCPCCSAPTAMP